MITEKASYAKPTTAPRIIIDTRESTPYSFSERVGTIRRKLDTGDYSLEGMESTVAVERKTLDDFLGSITGSRANITRRQTFFKELARLKQIPFRMVLIECTWDQILIEEVFRESTRKRVNHASVLGTIDCIQVDYSTQVFFGGQRECACAWVERYLTRIWNLTHKN